MGQQRDLVLHAAIAIKDIAEFQMGDLSDAHSCVEAQHDRHAVACSMALIGDHGQHALQFRFAEYLCLFHRFT
ncbi:hypothetical protein CCC_00462 [Paramagnetospirillum magnetotacticum MS-1]|uniref:Uncharacterized protein n=1 Tax=Paramagnetospirillum magnetotacticum MS-1 TaxID=272627 RepID=A0A0C2UX41_PARME|nr:hypothetical protein CCC_00462 [Paramagnetospirillum magnetotacticum MS-1]